MSKYVEFNNENLNKYKVSERKSKVNIDDFAKIDNVNINKFINSLPNILKAKDLKELIEKTYHAYINKKPIIIGIGGHVIKTGLSPLLIDLMKLGAIQGICCNGAVVIHDFELSCFGQTSEDVLEALEDGSFGMASDTCDTINNIISDASRDNLGYGEAVGKYLSNNAKFPELSLVKNAYELDIPVTVHVAIGTDIVHQHETADGKAIGDCSLRDFRIFTNLVSQLGDGGVFINIGSAVIIPEVFLKALTICRNKNIIVKNFTTAVFDMNYHYRPQTNVAHRPVYNSGKGYYFVGHHEIMVPLFIHSLKEYITR